MPVTVKICGVRDPAALAAASEAGADWIGLVFFPPSPRALSPVQASALLAGAPARPRRAGLFVDPTDHEVAAVLAHVPLDALQVYAGAARIASLKARFGLPVWHAIGVGAPGDLPSRAGAADRLLLDAKPPAGADRPGGNAVRFDWRMLRCWTAPAPWILAGGLNPANVGAAIRATGAKHVDVSSGVERAPGVKDPELIRAFIAAAKASE